MTSSQKVRCCPTFFVTNQWVFCMLQNKLSMYFIYTRYGLMMQYVLLYHLHTFSFFIRLWVINMLIVNEAIAYALRMWVCCSKRTTCCTEGAARHCADTERADYEWHSASSPMRQSPSWPTLEPAASTITHAWFQAPEMQCDFLN